MPNLTQQRLTDYRRDTFRLDPTRRLHSKEEAVQFANERGFIFFWPIKGVLLPSLWAAVAGDRPVADEHDDPGHITWGWKDNLLDKRVWYYARILRRRNSILSLDLLPFFYALSPNYGDPDEDYLLQYEQGLLTQESKLVYEALLKEGPLDSISLRRAARLASPENTSRFNRALDSLQFEFKVLPTGIAEAGAWRYAFIYDLTHRYYPKLVELAGPISEPAARQQLLTVYYRSLGAAARQEAGKLFGWRPEDLERTFKALIDRNILVDQVVLENSTGPVAALAELV
ncbi:MAG: AlkZ-related protein [Bellilinea sp.]